jgi:hypothetical protein
LVTTALRNPTTPVAGVVTRAAAAVGAAAAATDWVVSVLELLSVNACAVGTALDLVVVADSCATVATTFAAPVAVVGDDGVVVALTAAECVEFDSVLAGVGVGSSVSGAGVAGGVLG